MLLGGNPKVCEVEEHIGGKHPGHSDPVRHRRLGTYGGRYFGGGKETAEEPVGGGVGDTRRAPKRVARGGQNRADGRREGIGEDGGGGGRRGPVGKSGRDYTYGVSGR